jgi:hypothetical protein
VSDKIAPVTFRSAKPVDPKTRHPFSGEVLDAGVPVESRDKELIEPPATPPESFRTVIADLKLRRAELDHAIDLLERLQP